MRLHPLTVFNYSIKNQAGETVDIFVDGDIVDSPTKEFLDKYWGDETSTSFKSFRDQIPANVKVINLVVNSGGGHVGDAMAMHDYMKELESKGVTINRKGMGIIASAATYLLMGENSEMTENSWFMIHNASGFAYGDVNQVENQAKALRKFNDRIVSFYAKATGLSETVIGNMMDKETWLTAQEAKDKGFVKNVSGSVPFTNSIKEEHWQFSNMAVLNAYNSFTKSSKSDDMKIENIQKAIENGFASLAEKLGLKDKQNDETVKNAFAEFSTGITNALKDEVPTDEKVQEVVNKAVTEALNKLGESEAFKNALTESTKNFASKEDIKNMATKDDIKNVVTSEDLAKQLKDTTDAITNAISGKIGNKGGKTKEETTNTNERRKTPRNKYSDAALWEE